MTSQILEREVADWDRFQNRRQVTSYTGLCPREDTSSQRRFRGSINKHDNRRLRPVLVEGAWRLLVFQPEFRLVKKWRAALLDKKSGPSRRKKIIIALARSFAVGLVVRAHRALQSRRRWTQTPTGAAAENPSQMNRPIFLMNDGADDFAANNFGA
jgi:hypothetical protein